MGIVDDSAMDFAWQEMQDEQKKENSMVAFRGGCQCTCPFHHDATDDATGTRCTKTLEYDGDLERAHVIRVLKAWCLSGRQKTARALKPGGHKHVQPRKLPLLSDSVLDAQLAAGVADVSWVIVVGAAVGSSSWSSSGTSEHFF